MTEDLLSADLRKDMEGSRAVLAGYIAIQQARVAKQGAKFTPMLERVASGASVSAEDDAYIAQCAAQTAAVDNLRGALDALDLIQTALSAEATTTPNQPTNIGTLLYKLSDYASKYEFSRVGDAKPQKTAPPTIASDAPVTGNTLSDAASAQETLSVRKDAPVLACFEGNADHSLAGLVEKHGTEIEKLIRAHAPKALQFVFVPREDRPGHGPR